ncbi:MAG: D-alanyl-D-alanine dipeptidase, partial [Comamonas sp.]
MAPIASLVPITEDDHDVRLHLAYATPENFTGKVVYRNAYCYLHPDAEKALSRAALSARQAGVRLLVFDAYRPAKAQQILFDFAQDPTFVADPKRGSHHTRGCAVDVSLLDENGREMDMGTGFDAMQAESFHFCVGLSEQVQKNRLMLLGIMLSAGFEHIPSEW